MKFPKILSRVSIERLKGKNFPSGFDISEVLDYIKETDGRLFGIHHSYDDADEEHFYQAIQIYGLTAERLQSEIAMQEEALLFEETRKIEHIVNEWAYFKVVLPREKQSWWIRWIWEFLI